MTTQPTNRNPFSDWRPAAGTRRDCGELELTIPIDRDSYFTITADPDTAAMVPVVLRQLLAQPKPEGDGLFHWRNLGDGKPVQVRECPMCGIAPANVDDCGRFGDPACPYFGVGEPEPEEVKELVDWLNASAREWADLGEYDEGSKCHRSADILTRFARPTIKPVPVSEPPWEREGWCDADMTNQHPITPSSELIKMVSLEAQAAFPGDEGGGVETDKAREEYIAIFFSRWGADQELRACVEKVRLMEGNSIAEELFEARRPNHATP